MSKLDWRSVALGPGVLREPAPDTNRIIFWLPGREEQGFQHWERIANVPGAEIAVEQGLCFTQATTLSARRKTHGFFGKLLAGLKKTDGATSWLLPSGGYAEQVGERQSGLLLVWYEEDSEAPDEARLQARWGGGHQLRKVGPNLFVVSPGQADPRASAEAPTVLGKPREQSERLLAAARQAGNRQAEATALTDLGVVFMRGGDNNRALVILEEAFSLARELQDRTREYDAMTQLALAHAAVGQPARGQELLGQALAYAKENGDRFAEKLILGNLGTVLAAMRDYGEAITTIDHALTLAREIGDRPHEADLLWFQAILNADLGRYERAASLAQAAIDIHATLRSPHVAWLSSHLKKYRPAAPAPTLVSGRHPGGYYTGPAAVVASAPTTSGTAGDPAVLRSAWTALKALSTSTTSGMKTVPTPTYQKRLETCGTCPEHTGVRCKACAAFTAAKAWFPRELCPLDKWPA
jgi:tetratricopeptide (TPR) repeat protein